MSRLTKKDEQGNWCLKGLAWKDIHVGKVITDEIRVLLYGALWKLMEYEDAGYTPEQIRNFDEMYLKKCREVNDLRKRMQWIPVTERLPEDCKDVIVWYEYFRYGNYNRMYQTYGIGYQHEGHWGGCVSGICARCIAWMPLPEPYRELSHEIR